MKSLTDLLSNPKDRAYLEERGVFATMEDFHSALFPCERRSALQKQVLPDELWDGHVIWAGQQLYADYRHSVMSKIRVLHELKQRPGLTPFFLCADTDRSGSEKAITTIHWPLPKSTGTLQMVKVRAARHTESRFVPSEMTRREDALRKLKDYLKQSVDDLTPILPRYEQFKGLFLEKETMTLADVNLAITRQIMQAMGYKIPSFLLSELLNRRALHQSVNRWLNRREACIRAFNEAVEELEKREIETAVRSLPEDYLPLNYSCPKDQSRFRLRYEKQGSEHFAVGTSRKGNPYRFSLGQGELDFAELADTERWSPDVSLPVFFNDIVSGAVVGKSSALYGLVMNRVLERAMEQRPVPMLVPAFHPDEKKPEPDSALYHYLIR